VSFLGATDKHNIHAGTANMDAVAEKTGWIGPLAKATYVNNY
jgi:hypothetical protein